MKKQLDLLLASAHRYNLLDYTVLKLCLLSLGTMVGCSFSRFFEKHRKVLAAVFVISYGLIMVKTITGYCKVRKQA